MGRTWVRALGVALALLVAANAFAQATSGAGTQQAVKSLEDEIARIKQPVSWFGWGADLRLRQEYMRNAVDLNSAAHGDLRNYSRERARVWVKFGPVLNDAAMQKPNGLSVYARMTYESRYYFQGRPANTRIPQWDEIVYDNLYVDWTRIAGAPVSLRVGRQDIVYGRGFVILEGTPLDGSRTIYNDAARMSLHLDEVDTVLDLFVMDNKGRQSRLEPILGSKNKISEFDTKVAGAYLITKAAKPTEINLYYIYKEEDPIRSMTRLPGRNINTVGGLAQSMPGQTLDYYGEFAYQWGKEGTVDRYGVGASLAVGYTFKTTPMQPRIGYVWEYLSGDKQDTTKVEAWDPVLARWPQWSELLAYRWAHPNESGRPGYFTNLSRTGVNVGVLLAKDVSLKLEHSFVYANQHTLGRTGAFDSGRDRGQLSTGLLTWKLNKHLAGHFTVEYFQPGHYYGTPADQALFARWEVTLTF